MVHIKEVIILLKNIVYDYNDYKDQIFKGDGIYVDSAFFSGFKFFEDDHLVFITFQIVTEENKIITLNYSLKFDSESEYDIFDAHYGEFKTVGTSCLIKIPALLQISCFYKEKTKSEESYWLYCKHIVKSESKVYKLNFSKHSYLYIMRFMNALRMYDIKEYSDYVDYNNYSDSETFKITSDYLPRVRAAYFTKIGGKLFNKKYFGWYAVTFKNRNNTHLRLLFPTVELTETIKDSGFDLNKAFKSSEEFYDFLQNKLEYEDTYTCSDLVETEFSLTANTPMNYYTIIAMDKNGKTVYIDMSPEIYKDMLDSYYNFMKK